MSIARKVVDVRLDHYLDTANAFSQELVVVKTNLIV